MSLAALSVLSHAAVLALALFGGLTFVEADLPGVWAHPHPVLGTVKTSFRHVDVDGDGGLDLLTERYVAFQRNGLFPADARIPLPTAEPEAGNETLQPSCDVWGRDLFLRSEKALRRARWQDGAWQDVLSHAVAWPSEPYNEQESVSQEGHPKPGVRLRRFLHDLDGDAIPEIAVAAKDGIHVYVLKNGAYAETTVLNVYPPLQVMPEDDECLWPPDGRALQLPVRGMGCTILLNQGSVTVVDWNQKPDGRLRTRLAYYGLDASNGFALLPAPPKRETVDVGAAIEHVWPYRLNNDDTLDYVAVAEEIGRARLLQGSFPVWQTCASTDGGATFQAFRFQGFRPRTVFVDFDGDGDSDLVTEPTGLFDGGLRETVARMMTRRSFEHEVCVHLQDANGVFPEQPSVRGRFTVECEDVLFRGDLMLSHYQHGWLVDPTGDFNGDGNRDVVIYDQPTRLALYLSQGDGFQKKPETTCAIEPGWLFQAIDVDGNGLSDIVMWWTGYGQDSKTSGQPESRVFLTREAAP